MSVTIGVATRPLFELLVLRYPVPQNTRSQGLEARIKSSPAKPTCFRNHFSHMNGKGLKWVTASGALGVKNLNIPMGAEKQDSLKYTVRLFFSEPEKRAKGERVFNVSIQGQKVLSNFDISAVSGGTNLGLVKQFEHIQVGSTLKVTFEAIKGTPLICGIECLLENSEAVTLKP